MERSRRLIAPAALALALLAVAVIVVANRGGSYRLTAVFHQVYGLIPGADVEAGGLRVGKVESIWIARDGLPHVEMSIEDGYQAHAGAFANLRQFSAAGEVNRFVSLTQGGGPPLSDGATLGLGHTDEPVEVYQLLDMLDPHTRAQVRAMFAGLDLSFLGRGTDIRAALQNSAASIGNTAAMLAEVNSDGQALRTLVHDGRVLVSTLASSPADLGAMADQMAATLHTTAGRQAELAQSALLLAPGLHSAQSALAELDRSTATLDGFVRDAAPGARQLVPFSAALEPALLAAPAALHSADRLVRAAPADARALTPLLRTLRPILPLLQRVLGAANPILDQLRVRLPDFFSFFANWADFSADYDANGHAARIGLVFSPAPTKPVTPCQQAPGVLLEPFLRSPGVLGGQPWTNYQSTFIGGGSKPAQETKAGC